MTRNPAIRAIVETSIDVSDMGRARQFHESFFRFEVIEHSHPFCAFRVGPDGPLLFTQGASDPPRSVTAGVIPPHPAMIPQTCGGSFTAEQRGSRMFPCPRPPSANSLTPPSTRPFMDFCTLRQLPMAAPSFSVTAREPTRKLRCSARSRKRSPMPGSRSCAATCRFVNCDLSVPPRRAMPRVTAPSSKTPRPR